MTKIFTKREKVVLYITVSIIIFSIAFSYFIIPILTKDDDLNKEINAAKIKLQRYLQVINQKEYIQDKYNKFSGYAGTGVVIEEGASGGILSDLEGLAKASGVRIIDIRSQEPKKADLYKETIIDLRLEGAMEDYLKFIYSLENSLLLLRVKRIQLNAKPNSQVLEGSLSVSKFSDF